MRPVFRHPLSFFFFNDTATTEIYTLSLHDALPISNIAADRASRYVSHASAGESGARRISDRKSTRLNSSHANISYAVFCLKKKNIGTKAEETRGGGPSGGKYRTCSTEFTRGFTRAT